MAFNLAAITWPGWGDEPRPSDPPADRTRCRAPQPTSRARARTRALILSKSHWLLGAHLMAAGDLGGAQSEFRLAQAKAAEASEGVHERLGAGYELVARLLDGDRDAEAPFQQVVARLRSDTELEDSVFFADQLEKVRRVFSAPVVGA